MSVLFNIIPLSSELLILKTSLQLSLAEFLIIADQLLHVHSLSTTDYAQLLLSLPTLPSLPLYLMHSLVTNTFWTSASTRLTL